MTHLTGLKISQFCFPTAYKSHAETLRDETGYPVKEDYKGALEAILRLQQTYNLTTSEIANGYVGREHRSVPLQGIEYIF